ncbi:hypothetical protein M422DRAFT_254879 [Sphaerobolus stellatus SS14]|uniref:Uncharacterized protein n=1 Tax=Sphaerobolus stellatus (strain SS14) TaxID=990650 RepID=A0A0C9UGI7_SPHS4|nr:hypothetical protein M422DRAFT_254879 [Sphaerobolus stellatus SS14]
MSVPNALRDDCDSYFLEEDIDVAAWISKVASDISRPAFMEQMKAVFGSHDNFDTAFSGFTTNLLKPDHEATMWITDLSTLLRIGTHIVKDWPPKSQDTKPEKLPTGPDFLALVLEHCALTRAQVYGQIIPYMIRHEAKRPCSHAGSERAAYMHLNQRPPAPHKGKRPVTASLQSWLSAHMPTPVQTGESSHQWLDEDLDNYNQVHDPVLPYEEEPPSSEPEAGDVASTMADVNSILPDENTMDIDQICTWTWSSDGSDGGAATGSFEGGHIEGACDADKKTTGTHHICTQVTNSDYDDNTHRTSLDDLRTPPQAAPPTSPSSCPSHTTILPASVAPAAKPILRSPSPSPRQGVGACNGSQSAPTTGQSPDTPTSIESDLSPTAPLPACLLHRLHLINHSSYSPPPPALLPEPISLSTQLQLQTSLLHLLF